MLIDYSVPKHDIASDIATAHLDKAAITTYESAVAAFRNDRDKEFLPPLGEVHKALELNQLLLAKQNWNNKNKRLSHLIEAESILFYAELLRMNDDTKSALSNLAYTNWLLGNSELAEDQLRETLRESGKPTLEETITISKQHALPTDAKFHEPAQQIWESITTSDHVIETRANSSEPKEQQLLARTYLARAEARSQQDKKASINTYNAMVAKLDNATDPKVQAAVANAYIKKAMVQSLLEDDETFTHDMFTSENNHSQFPTAGDSEMATYDALISKYSHSQLPTVQEYVLSACLRKAPLLKSPTDKITLYEKALAHKNNIAMTSPRLEQLTTYIHDRLASTKLLVAKKNWEHQQQRTALLDQALLHFNKVAASAFVDSYHKESTSGSIAYTQWLLGNQKVAKRQLREALVSGEIHIYQALTDLVNEQKVVVATDDEFKALLVSTWEKQLPEAK